MVEGIQQGGLAPFTTVKYVTKDGEHCSATKENGIVTVVGDKTGVRQMPLDDFMKEFVQTLPKINLEKSPAQDTVAFSSNPSAKPAEEKKSSNKGWLLAAGAALVAGAAYLLTRGKAGKNIISEFKPLTEAVESSANKGKKTAEEIVDEMLAEFAERNTTKLSELPKPGITPKKAPEVITPAPVPKPHAAAPEMTPAEKVAKDINDIFADINPQAKPKATTPKVEVEVKPAVADIKPEIKAEPKKDPFDEFAESLEESLKRQKEAEKQAAKEQKIIDDDNNMIAAAMLLDTPVTKGAEKATKAVENAAEKITSKLDDKIDDVISHNPFAEKPVNVLADDAAKFSDDLADDITKFGDDVVDDFNSTSFLDDLNKTDDYMTDMYDTFKSNLDDFGSDFSHGIDDFADDFSDGFGF